MSAGDYVRAYGRKIIPRYTMLGFFAHLRQLRPTYKCFSSNRSVRFDRASDDRFKKSGGLRLFGGGIHRWAYSVAGERILYDQPELRSPFLSQLFVKGIHRWAYSVRLRDAA
jgi:hypothetical protein